MSYKSREARFALLVEACSVDLYRYAAWLCGDRALAEDLVQDTYMRAWRALHGLKHEHAVKIWLFTLLRREYARENARQRLQITRAGDGVADVGRFDHHTEACALRQALLELPPEYREPLALQVIGGFSSEQIAQLLEMTPGAVLSHLFRARRQLRHVLDDVRLHGSSKVMA